MRQLKLGVIVGALMLAGCAKGSPPPPPLPPLPPPPAQPAPATQTCPDGSLILATEACPALAVVYMPVAALIASGQNFVSVGGGYATVLLKPGHATRSTVACTKFIQSMPAAEVLVDRPTVQDGMLVYDRPVYWLVRTPTSRRCDRMVQNYDFRRAGINIRRIRGWEELGQGPFVVVWKRGGRQAGLFDFSYVPAKDFGREFEAVVRYMSRRSDVWNPSFYKEASYKDIIKLYLTEGTPAPRVIARMFQPKAA